MQKKIILFLSISFLLGNVAYADIEDVHGYYLDKEYDAAIAEAKNILSNFSTRNEAAEAYFYLGLSQMRLGYYKDARDSFREIASRFSQSDFGERAYLSVADSFFLEENYSKADEIYKSFLKEYPHSDILNLAYFKLGQTNLKLGNWDVAKSYLRELKNRFPDSLEAKLVDGLLARDEFFTVQVAAFINPDSAKKLNNKLISDGFDSYLVKTSADNGKTMYRVRVGRFSNRYDAESIQSALALKGYPTRIYP